MDAFQSESAQWAARSGGNRLRHSQKTLNGGKSHARRGQNLSGEGAKELFDLLEKRKSDVESLIRTVKGFVSYSLVRTADGGISVTVCQDKAGADDSVQKAKDWIGGNASNIGASAPKVSEGSVILHLK